MNCARRIKGYADEEVIGQPLGMRILVLDYHAAVGGLDSLTAGMLEGAGHRP